MCLFVNACIYFYYLLSKINQTLKYDTCISRYTFLPESHLLSMNCTAIFYSHAERTCLIQFNAAGQISEDFVSLVAKLPFFDVLWTYQTSLKNSRHSACIFGGFLWLEEASDSWCFRCSDSRSFCSSEGNK